jgi:hypothetical protein
MRPFFPSISSVNSVQLVDICMDQGQNNAPVLYINLDTSQVVGHGYPDEDTI